MARRAAYVNDQIKQPEHVLNLDCGDFLSGGREIDSIKADFLLKGFSKLNIDAINVGERDFMLGPQWILDIQKKYELPFISANVYFPDSSRRFLDPYIIRKFKEVKTNDARINSVKVGIFGVVLNRPVLVYSKHTPKLITTDPFRETEKVLRELKGKCDVVIALAHLPSNELHDFRNRFPDIDLIIGGHSFYNEIIADSTGLGTLIETGSKGQFVGNIEMILDKDRKSVQVNAFNQSLELDMPQDPDLKTLEEESEEAIRRFYDARTKQQSIH
ncbi:hypothetical protein JXB12_02375 [candidate division KSB1 bacterium]|nr:hypothetical protein [candidate division KSB1 bacterium]